jgi:hypothetical protein
MRMKTITADRIAMMNAHERLVFFMRRGSLAEGGNRQGAVRILGVVVNAHGEPAHEEEGNPVEHDCRDDLMQSPIDLENGRREGPQGSNEQSRKEARQRVLEVLGNYYSRYRSEVNRSLGADVE